VGEAVGVKDQKGILNLVLHELDVSCLPGQIPERIDADVSPLHIGELLTVADLRVPEGVRMLNDGGQAVVTVRPPMAEETPAAAAPEVAATVTTEPEVLTERKAKEGEEPAKADESKRAAKK
jgi:large subunit ribosomal protein L25